MPEKFVTKTRTQLVNLIVRHAAYIFCDRCGIALGKYVCIPVDADKDLVTTLHYCAQCYESPKWWIIKAFTRLLTKLHKSTEVLLPSGPPGVSMEP